MKLAEKLSRQSAEQIWDEYCGFLNLELDQYMHIQNRLMEEQMQLWCNCQLGKRILDGKQPSSVEEFREMVPLTEYEDYADILLLRQADMLPAPPLTWVETTWEGGKRPIKVAPYSQGFLDIFRRNCIAVMLFTSSKQKGKYELGDKALSGLAPLPYLTGVMGLVMEQEFKFTSMPPQEASKTMGFTDRTKLGFKMAMKSGVDYFFGLGSISYFISKQLMLSSGKSGSKKSSLGLTGMARGLRGKMRAKKEERGMFPKDLFQLKGFICAGTDNACYKDELEELWGIRPTEIFAGTECGLVGTETWNRKDLYFFPDACYYEFIPKAFVREKGRNLPTLTIDQVQVNEEYELVITTFKGGAFARYRTNDVYRCVGIGDKDDDSSLPKFRYIDRIPPVIDIAGFTRITENSINDVIAFSHLPIKDWCAAKEYESETGHPFLHMYIEMEASGLASQAVSEEVLRNHLGIYFNYLDSDYMNLKKILEMEPLQITFLRIGTFEAYKKRTGSALYKINPDKLDLALLQKIQSDF